MDTKVFFERGDEFKDNPLHFAVHRISNTGTHGEVTNALLRLEAGDIEGCKKKLELIKSGMVRQIEFLRQFAKEYDEFKEAGNVIIPKRTKYTIAIAEINEQVQEGKTLLKYPDGSLKIHPNCGLALDNIKPVEALIISDEDVPLVREAVSGKIITDEKSRPIIGKAPQFIIDGLVVGLYEEGDKVKVKMKKTNKQARYTNGDYAREYHEVEVPEVINGIVTCEK
jgi:hypothetical protein